MPFPLLIPIGLGLTSLATGVYGVKKGYDAIKCNNEAKNINLKASSTYSEARELLNQLREETNRKMENLGKLKIEVYTDVLGEYISIFQKIKNISFDDNLKKEFELYGLEFDNLLEIKNQILKIEELAGGTAAALGSGALAGFGAFGGAGMLATASTGTAISSLSGAAATNATLAWFGGGSLATGGLGIAGGTVILGGVATAPILAVAGSIFAAKAEKNKSEAEINLNKANTLSLEMDATRIVVNGIKERVEEFIQILVPLVDIFDDILDNLEEIVRKNTDYSTYKDEEKKLVFVSYSIAETLKNLCDTPILDEDGKITRKSKRVLKKTKEFVAIMGDKLNG